MPKIQLTITIDEAGQPHVSGPVNDLILALGLLELGKKLVIDHNDRRAKGPGIVQATAPVAAMLAGGN